MEVQSHPKLVSLRFGLINHGQIADIMNWCENNCQGHWFHRNSRRTGFIMFFKEQNDCVTCSLRFK